MELFTLLGFRVLQTGRTYGATEKINDLGL